MSADVLAVLVGLLAGALGGWWVPAVIARIPEPEPEPETEEEPEPGEDPAPASEAGEDRPAAEADVVITAAPSKPARPGLPPPPPKEPYAAIAARPGLRWKCAVATAAVGAVLAGSVGWSGALLFLLPLAPVGVLLSVVDWRTTLLPSRVIWPTYAVTAVGVLLAAAIDRDAHDLLRAGIGLVAMWALYYAIWRIYPRGLGFGDVRLSGILGGALGYLGWSEWVSGFYAAWILGSVGGLLLVALRLVKSKRYPFGPFMVVGALVAVAFGPWLLTQAGYG